MPGVLARERRGGGARIGDALPDDALRQAGRRLLLGDDASGPGGDRLGDEPRAVGGGAADGDERVAGLHETGVGLDGHGRDSAGNQGRGAGEGGCAFLR